MHGRFYEVFLGGVNSSHVFQIFCLCIFGRIVLISFVIPATFVSIIIIIIPVVVAAAAVNFIFLS